jgi:hypothetical protein
MAKPEDGKARSTAPLRVICRSNLQENCLNIHPNDGFDLGLMTTSHSVQLESGKAAEICLVNDCPKECLELNSRLWERLGKPKSAILKYDGTYLSVEKL